MTTVRIGLPTGAFGQPVRRALATAARLGADGVEIDLRSELPLADMSQSAIRQFRKLLDDYNLRLAAASYPTRRGYEDPAELDRRMQGTKQAMKVAAELGGRVLVNRIFGELPEQDSTAWDAMMHALESLAHEGARVGTQLAALTTTAPVDDLARVLNLMPDGTIGVALNPANLLAGGQSPLDTVEQLGPLVSYLYASDAVRDLGAKRTEPVELGRGSADLPALLAALDARGYTGWVTAEPSGVGDASSELSTAVAFLRSLSMA